MAFSHLDPGSETYRNLCSGHSGAILYRKTPFAPQLAPCPSASASAHRDHGPASARGALCPLGDPIGNVPMRCHCCSNCRALCTQEANDNG
jgi:hypothetical protein